MMNGVGIYWHAYVHICIYIVYIGVMAQEWIFIYIYMPIYMAV